MKNKFLLSVFFSLINYAVSAQTFSININANSTSIPENFIGLSIDPAYYGQYFGTNYNTTNTRIITQQLLNNLNPYQKTDIRILGNNSMYWQGASPYNTAPSAWNNASGYVCTSCPATTPSFNASNPSFTASDLSDYKSFLNGLNYKPTTIFGISLAHIDPNRAANFASTISTTFTGYPFLFEISNEPDAFVSNNRRTNSYSLAEFTNEFNLIKNVVSVYGNVAGPVLAKTNNTTNTWSPQIGTFIDNVGSSLKLVTVHDYPLGLDQGSTSWLSKYLDTKYTNDAVSNTSSGLAPLINTSKSKNVPFRLAEANSIAGGGTLGVSDAFGSALWSMDFMFELAKAGSTGINFMTAGGSSTYYSPFTYSSSFVTSGNKVRVNPIYYGMLLFAKTVQNGGRLLSVSPQTNANPNITVWSCKDSLNTIRVLIINRGTSTTDVANSAINLNITNAKMTAKRYDLIASGGSITGALGKTVASGATYSLAGQTISQIDGKLMGTETTTSITPINGVYTISTIPAGTASLIEIPSNDCSVSTPTSPIANNSSISYCINATATPLTATASIGNLLQWYSVATGGIASTTAPTPLTNTATTNTYYVSQKDTIANCESSSIPIVVTINPLPVVAAITGVSSVKVGSTISLTNTTAGGIWSSSNAAVASISGAGVVTGIAIGSTIITYSYTNNNGCSNSSSLTISVTAQTNPAQPPTITVTGNTSFCIGDSVQLSSSENSGNQWFKDGAIIANAVSKNYTASTSGSYTVVVNGVSSAATNIIANPLPVVNPISGINQLNVGATITLTNTTSGGSWQSSNTNIATINSSGIVNGIAIGSTTIFYSYTNSGGCTTTVSSTITVVAAPIITPTISSTGATTFCAGNTIVLNSSENTGNQWYKDGSLIANATAKTYTASTTGAYTVMVNGVSSVATNIVVNAIPPTPTITRNQMNQLVSSADVGNQWYKEITIIGGEINKIYQPNSNGNYSVKTIQNGCESAISASYPYLLTGIYNLSNTEYLKVLPNPFYQNISIQFSINQTTKINIELIEMASGRLVFAQQNILSNSLINLSRLNKGSYLLKITDKNRLIQPAFKLVKL
jgi:hypothetical protein